MTEKIVQYVRIKDVPRFKVEGWVESHALKGTNHGKYATLMVKESEDDARDLPKTHE